MSYRFIAMPLLAASLLAFSTAPAPEVMHLYLASSSPEADAMVHEISAIQLVFSESPQDNSVSARLLDAAGDLVETPSPESHGEDGVAFAVALTDGLEPGAYTVAWRAMGSDGHVVRGDFGFTFMKHGDVVDVTNK